MGDKSPKSKAREQKQKASAKRQRAQEKQEPRGQETAMQAKKK